MLATQQTPLLPTLSDQHEAVLPCLQGMLSQVLRDKDEKGIVTANSIYEMDRLASQDSNLKALFLKSLLEKVIMKNKMGALLNILAKESEWKGPFIGQDYIISQKNNKNQKIESLTIELETGKQRLEPKDEREQSFLQKKQKIRFQSNLNFKKYNSRCSSFDFLKYQLQNKILKDKISSLELELEDCLRRQQKQIAKKKDSLQGLLDDLSEKSQKIEELQTTIRALQAKLGKNSHFVISMLQEDSQSLRKVVFKLQGVNNKLNNDIGKLIKEKESVQAESLKLIQLNKSLSLENKQLKEEIFELELTSHEMSQQKKQIELTASRLFKKIELLKAKERRLNESIKRNVGSSESLSNVKKVAETTYNTEFRIQNLKEVEVEVNTKMESVFSFLFNIQQESYQLHSPELFDDEEKQLLALHKQKFISKIREEASPKDDFLFGDIQSSVLDAFTESKEKNQKNNMKVIEMEIQKGKLIEKISELKDRQLHIRNVILNLLKSLEIKSPLKSDSQAILNVLCDYFEYSEEERFSFIQNKPKRFFGFI